MTQYVHTLHLCLCGSIIPLLLVSLQPMKALRASAGTSKPVLSSQQVQTVFYQVPEISDMHQSFFSGLTERLSAHCRSEPGPGEDGQMSYTGFELLVGDLFLKMVSLLCREYKVT